MIRYFNWNRNATNCRAALTQIVGKAQIERIMRDTADLRELVRNTSQHLSITEEALSNRVAEELGLPFVLELEVMDPARLNGSCSLTRFEQAGATLLLKDGKLLGLACIDPALARRLLPECRELNLFIAPWTAIQNVLKKSYEMQSTEAQLSEAEIDTLISDLFALTQKLSSTRLLIHFGDEKVCYSFTTGSGCQARGNIAPRAGRYLQARLELARVGASILRTRELPLGLEVQCLNTQPLSYLIEIGEAPRTTESPSNQLPEQEIQLKSFAAKRSAPIQIEPHPKDLVLFIDDEPTFANVLERHLKHQGFNTVHKSSGGEALEALVNMEIRPFAVVCDFHMPLMNGPEFVSSLRSSANFSELPVIILTSDSDIQVQLQAIASGADLFLNKTDNPKILCAHLRRFYERQLKKQEAA